MSSYRARYRRLYAADPSRLPLPLRITPPILLSQPLDSDSRGCLLFPELDAQLRYQVIRGGDGIPTSILIPRQPVTFTRPPAIGQPASTPTPSSSPTSPPPPRWLPEHSLPLISQFIKRPPWHSPGKPYDLHRRFYFRCPGRPCLSPSHYFPSLLLDLANRRRSRFRCRYCLDLPRPSDLIHWTVYQAARDPFSPSLTLASQLRALPLWWKWQTEGKPKGPGEERGAEWAGVLPDET